MDARLHGHDVSIVRCAIRRRAEMVQLHNVGTTEMARVPKRSAERGPTHPGAFLREMVLPAIAVSKVDIAAALGVSRQTLYDILAEKQPVTPGMAVRLGTVFETSSASWLRMQ